MKPKSINGKTRFHVQKRDKERLELVLAKFEHFKGQKLNWSKDGYYYVNIDTGERLLTCINQAHYDMIKRPKIVRGYHGCPMTGHQFAWMI